MISGPFSWLVSVRDLPSGGRALMRELTEAECTALAKFAGIHGVKSLTARGQITPWGGAGFAVQIEFSAEAVQACVVTLEPVPASLSGSFTRRYLPEGPERDAETLEVDVHIEEEDPPETFPGQEVDLAEPLIEEFVLALDPYPRVPGAVLPEELARLERSSPFDVLARLKDKT